MADIRIKVLNALRTIAEEATTEELYTTLITVDSPDYYYSGEDIDLEDLILKIEAKIENNA